MRILTTLMTLAIVSTQAVASSNECVFMLHGIARDKHHMQPLADYLSSEYTVINVSYPSTSETLEQLIERLNNEVAEKTIGCTKVHLVGYSMGGILVRAIAASNSQIPLGRVVQLAPPNNGSEVADFFKNFAPYKWIFGPAGQQLTTDNAMTQDLIGAVNYELGVIAGVGTIDPISSYLIIKEPNDGKVSVKSTMVKGMQDHIIIKGSHFFFPSNKQAQEQTMQFLQTGKFDR